MLRTSPARIALHVELEALCAAFVANGGTVTRAVPEAAKASPEPAEPIATVATADTVLFVVTAEHVSPRFCFALHPVRTRRDRYDGTWYAVADGLGCSKNYRTARDAAASLFHDNACTHVRIY